MMPVSGAGVRTVFRDTESRIDPGWRPDMEIISTWVRGWNGGEEIMQEE